MYRVLLVDDEINIVDALQDALQQMDDDRIEYVKACLLYTSDAADD